MKKFICCYIILTISSSLVHAQEVEEQVQAKKWEFSTDMNFYFIPDDFIVLPVFRADKNVLHLEARYNYEDIETFSGWVGYNFMGGKEFEYTITPMVGGVVGVSNGIAPGLEVTLAYKGFELYTEAEYLFESESTDNNFFYNWTDFTYSPKDWLWFGISAQRTRLYKTDLDIQRGLLVGTGLKQWELTTYLYNLAFDDPFVLVTISFAF